MVTEKADSDTFIIAGYHEHSTKSQGLKLFNKKFTPISFELLLRENPCLKCD